MLGRENYTQKEIDTGHAMVAADLRAHVFSKWKEIKKPPRRRKKPWKSN
jgi:hypothetical protein